MQPETPLITTALISDADDDIIQTSLDFVREHLDMEVGYLSEFVGENLVFRHISAPGLEDMIAVGDGMPLDQVYCPYILDGRLPELIPDTADVPLTQDIAMTHALPIRSHVSIPIKRRDGSTYGMFCCLSRTPRPSLNDRDLNVMRAFARLSSETINGVLDERMRHTEMRNRISQAIDGKEFTIFYQPIMDAKTRTAKGYEALCRFHHEPYRTPDLWFEDARQVGLQVDLEIAAISKALRALNKLPEDIYVSVNASPKTVESGRLMDVFADFPCDRIVLELTEHVEIGCYDRLMKKLEVLRFHGIRIAIDDAGAGYAGLQHIVRLRPDIIKLDISLTSNIDQDLVRRSLATALVGFANETNALMVAEGVETEMEFATLKYLGIDLMQGYLLGRPADLSVAMVDFGSVARRKVG
ncbi:EAL domain-containing protein [Sulfitobacter sp. 1151]|uniref:EAL domain-containing protein n=2 Tax=Parasulfitobacter algicola TaxID=2614809 RepID=A0ABX2IW04_9RHOB|nr:EAL domain-containing protein [Sulfitobacter algicola]NSX54579.1 EAL domain-containing protein [Sulfitobacter algicola]